MIKKLLQESYIFFCFQEHQSDNTILKENKRTKTSRVKGNIFFILWIN
jgi:hypothetical protein